MQQSDQKFYQEIEELVAEATHKKPSPILNLPEQLTKRQPLFLAIKQSRRINLKSLKFSIESAQKQSTEKQETFEEIPQILINETPTIEESKINNYQTPVTKQLLTHEFSTKIKGYDESEKKVKQNAQVTTDNDQIMRVLKFID